MSLPQTSPSVGLTHLDRADLTVLDLGLSYLVDALREDPGVLPAPEERVALRDLHRQVLALKSGDAVTPRPKLSDFPIGRRFGLVVDGAQTTGRVLRHSWLASQRGPDLAVLLELKNGRKRRVLWTELTPTEEEPPERQMFWRAPSGRVHSLRSCTGGPGPRRMRKVELTRTEFDALVVGGFASRHEDERCRCAAWKETT